MLTTRRFRAALKTGALRLTRGQLVNIAAVLHGQPTPFPAKGPGRNLQVRVDDCFIVSYPRSGNTWLRFLIANLRRRDAKVDYGSIEKIIPDIYISDELKLRAMKGPRVLKSHEAFDPRYRRVIYLIRDPRDVIISQFVTLRRLRSDIVGTSFDEFVIRQIGGEFDAWFGSWSAHVNSWIHQDKADLDLLLIRYEDIQENTLAVSQKVAEFLGLSCAEEDLRTAVENSSRGRMHDLYERSGSSLADAVGEGNAGHLRPTNIAGKPIITGDIERIIRQRYGVLMDALGYV